MDSHPPQERLYEPFESPSEDNLSTKKMLFNFLPLPLKCQEQAVYDAKSKSQRDRLQIILSMFGLYCTHMNHPRCSLTQNPLHLLTSLDFADEAPLE